MYYNYGTHINEACIRQAITQRLSFRKYLNDTRLILDAGAIYDGYEGTITGTYTSNIPVNIGDQFSWDLNAAVYNLPEDIVHFSWEVLDKTGDTGGNIVLVKVFPMRRPGKNPYKW